MACRFRVDCSHRSGFWTTSWVLGTTWACGTILTIALHALNFPPLINEVISPNVTSRFRDKKTGKPVVYAGRDAVSPFLDPASRMNLRSPFESNILTTVDALEGMMDYTFLKLGLENESRVEHPIVMTEPVGNLNYSRKATTELLFEAYNVPSVCYGIDSLFSFHYNTPDPQQGGMIVSSSNEFTYVIPYSKDNGHFELLRRITYGGSQATQYFLRLLQAKYPTFPVRVSTNQAESLLYDYGYVSTDYMDELRSFDDQETLDEKDLVVQFPFSVAPEKAEKTEEEKREIEEKKREQGKRLQEQAARKKEERIAEMEAYIEELRAVVAIRETDPETYAVRTTCVTFISREMTCSLFVRPS